MLYIFDRDFNMLGGIDNFLSLQWTEEYQGQGSFELVCADGESASASEYIRLLQQGRYIFNKDKNTAMVIRYLNFNSKEREITVRGYTTLNLLEQRVVYPMQKLNNTEQGMYELVEVANSNEREIPHLTTRRLLSGLEGFTYARETQITGTNLLEALSNLGVDSGLGFFMRFDFKGKMHVFEVYEGVDRTYGNETAQPFVFSTEYRNLLNVIAVDDMSIFRNVAYVGGGGEGAARKFVEVGDAEGIERFELFVDARDLQQEYLNDNGDTVTLTDVEYEENLTSRGVQKLNEHIRAESFNGNVDPFRFGVDYNLGDKITCESKHYGKRINARITSYTEITEKNKTMLSLTLGEPEITILQEIKTWL
jgi:hypothetical protein